MPKNKIFLIIGVFSFVGIFCFSGAKEVIAGSADNVFGWAWSENIGKLESTLFLIAVDY